MNVKDIEAEIQRYEWYQSIDLGHGIVTPGEVGDASREKLAILQLPEDLSGKSVLDIGCNEGFFSFEAERRNASSVLAIDRGRSAGRKLQLVREILGSKIEFRPCTLDDLDPADVGTFDIVFFLAVFHHLRHPFASLDRLASLTRGYALLEIVEAVADAADEPSALVRKISKTGKMRFLPTRKLILEMLERAGFAKVEILGVHRGHRPNPARDLPGFSERRVLVRAHRRDTAE